MEFDYSKLLGRIVEKFGTRSNFATAWGKSESVLSYKLNNKTQFTMEDIFEIIQPQLLDIPPSEIGVYFFTPKVRLIEP